MKSPIIDRLIQIEETAAEISRKDGTSVEAVAASVQSQYDKISARLKAEYEKKLSEINHHADDETLEALAKLERDSIVRYKKLDEYFEQNHKQWETDIFNSIFGR